MKKHQQLLLYIVILAVACLSNLPLMYGQFFGEDEVNQFWVSMRILNALTNWQGSNSVISIGLALSNTDHPPLRYILSLPGITLFPYSEFGLRFISILFSLLMTYQVTKLGNNIGGTRVGFPSGLLVASSGVYNWTSMAFGWSVIVTILVICIHMLRSASLDISDRQERYRFFGLTGLLFIAFLINTGTILFFASICLIYLVVNYRRLRLMIGCMVVPALFYAAYYGYYFAIFPWIVAQRQGTDFTPVGQLAHMLSRSERSHLNITAFSENLQGINAYLLPGVGWVLLGAILYVLLMKERRVFLFVAPFWGIWSFYFVRSTQQYFLLVFIALLPFGIAWLVQWFSQRQLVTGVTVLCLALLSWNVMLFIRPYTEIEYPQWLLERTFARVERHHNIIRPYTAIGQDIDTLLSPTGTFIHRIGGSFTEFYYRDDFASITHYDFASITHSRHVGAPDSPAFPTTFDSDEQCVRLDNVHQDDSNVEIVVGRFLLCSDVVAVTRTYPGSPIRLYVLKPES